MTGRPPLPARLRIALSALGARRARARGDLEAYRRHILAIIDLAFGQASEDPPDAEASGLRGALTEFRPLGGTKGGFFACLATDAAGTTRFVKCVPTLGREMRFWDAWERGEIAVEGEHYRLLPPVARQRGRLLSLLVFPDLGPSPGLTKRRTSRYTGNLEIVVRAIADFNASHAGAAAPALKVSAGAKAHRVPTRRRIVRTLSVDRRSARRIARSLRAVEARWGALRQRLYGGPLCLSHMDFGPGNILIQPDQRPVILDFCHAALAPAGSDLHTVLRYARKGEGPVDPERLAAIYAEVFAARGIAVERAAVLFAAETHFASRYRNLRLGSTRDVFDEALHLSEALVGARAPKREP